VSRPTRPPCIEVDAFGGRRSSLYSLSKGRAAIREWFRAGRASQIAEYAPVTGAAEALPTQLGQNPATGGAMSTAATRTAVVLPHPEGAMAQTISQRHFERQLAQHEMIAEGEIDVAGVYEWPGGHVERAPALG
jgi:hypothetical protein